VRGLIVRAVLRTTSSVEEVEQETRVGPAPHLGRIRLTSMTKGAARPGRSGWQCRP
jgi:hypothetical protein